jgi:hypothetical protein
MHWIHKEDAMAYYEKDYSSVVREGKIMESLKDSDYHNLDELKRWLKNTNGSDARIVDMYDKHIEFDDYFIRNMTVLIQGSVLDSPLPIEFTMESVSLYLHGSYSIDSPIWRSPDQR